jgi:hypothetical protein
MLMKHYTEDQMISYLWDRVGKQTQLQIANDLKVSPSYLNDVLHLRRDFSAALAERLGFKRVVTYTRIAK